LLFTRGKGERVCGLLFKVPEGLDACFFFRIHQHATPKMTLFHTVLAQAPSPGPGAGMSQILFFGLLFAAMWFLMIAPQRKKQKQHEALIKALGNGDEVLTAGGIFGTVVAVKDDRFVVRIADNTKIELGKSFISSVVKKAEK
jgi:preprotein translocase subunit YajC